MKLSVCLLAVCAAAERHAPRPALLQRSELLRRPESPPPFEQHVQLFAAKEEWPDRTYTGRASIFDVFRAMEDEGAKRSGERPLKLLAKSIAAGVSLREGQWRIL